MRKTNVRYNTALLDDYIKEHNITKRELARRCRLSVHTIDNIYKNNNIIRYDTLLKI